MCGKQKLLLLAERPLLNLFACNIQLAYYVFGSTVLFKAKTVNNL